MLASPPPYIKLFPDEVIAWYEDISDRVKAPLVVYNWPHGTGIDIGSDLADRLADIESVVAIKDSTPDADQFFETSRRVRDRVRVFGPYMSARGVEVLRTEGGDGFVGGGSLNGSPDPAFWEDYWARRLRSDGGVRRACRPAVPEALAAGRVGRPLRLVPGSAQGAHAHARPARRPRAQPAAARSPIPAKLEAMRAVLVEEGMLTEKAAV